MVDIINFDVPIVSDASKVEVPTIYDEAIEADDSDSEFPLLTSGIVSEEQESEDIISEALTPSSGDAVI